MVPVRVTFAPCGRTPFTLSLVDGSVRRLSRSVVHAAPVGPDFLDSLAESGAAALSGLVLWVGFAAGVGVALELAERMGSALSSPMPWLVSQSVRSGVQGHQSRWASRTKTAMA